MTTIYDPVTSHYKIEVNSMGHFTVTRPRAGKRFFDADSSESKYLQFEDDTAPFEADLKALPLLPSGRRHNAYVDLINAQFE